MSKQDHPGGQRHAPAVTSIIDRFLLRGTVDGVKDVTPRMRWVRITGELLRGLSWVAGQHVRLRVGGGLFDLLRTYSVWDYDDNGSLELCVFDHEADGPGARWARAVEVGHSIALTRPEGRLVLRDDASFHLFVGDETASVAFGAMLRALPTTARVQGVVGAADDRLPLARADELTWVRQDTLAALRELDLPGDGCAYVAGEARACQAVRRHLTQERGWPRRSIVVKPFWAPGKRGMD
jgi:NADPH-dependent ferric siderophore reductase